MKTPNWHNPDNIPESELPSGRRFLTYEEFLYREKRQLSLVEDPDIWVWSGPMTQWSQSQVGYTGTASMTYCVPWPLPKEELPSEDEFGNWVNQLVSKMKENEAKRMAELEEKRALIERQGLAKYFQTCRVIVMQNPVITEEPFGKPVPPITLVFGKCEVGEINPDCEFEDRLGDTYKLANIISITP